jgi:histidine triad (HIT) family protein
MDECIFCKIINKEIPSEKIYEDDLVFGFLDINPVNLGHSLLIPKEHFENMHEVPDDLASHIIKIAKKISKAIKKSGAEGTVISMNNGSAAGQTVFHQHTHIIPRFEKDNLLPWPKKQPKKEKFKEIAQKIIKELAHP